MNAPAQVIRMCAFAAALCFVALAVISKFWIEPAGLAIFDSRLAGYDMADARALLGALTPAQTATYLGLFRQLDTVFPILLSVSLMGIIWLNTSAEARGRRMMALIGPAAYLVFDLSENMLVGRILIAGGGVLEEMVLRASTYTQAKWMCLALSLLVVVWAWRFAAKKGAA